MRNRQKPFTPSGRAAHGCRRSPERSDLRSSLNAAFQVRGSRTSLTSRRAMVPCVRSTPLSNPGASNASARSRRANNPVHPDYGKGVVIGGNPAAGPAGRIGNKCARHRFGLAFADGRAFGPPWISLNFECIHGPAFSKEISCKTAGAVRTMTCLKVRYLSVLVK